MKVSHGPAESVDDFSPGEWDHLLAEAEAGADSLDGEQVLAELRGLRSRAAEETGRKSD